MPIQVGDLFCGAGGFSHGVEQLGWETAWGVDSEPKAVETWEKNHTGVGVCGDVTEDDVRETIVNELADIDVLIGGPPCKDFSKSNRVIDKGRNNLVLVFMDYVALLQPDAFIIENVRQLETQYDDILESIYEIGDEYEYAVAHRTLNAADYGVAQNRVRTFIIGIRENGEQPKFPCPSVGPKSPSNEPYVTAEEAISAVASPTEDEAVDVTSKYADLLPEIPPGLNYSYYTEKLGHPEPEFEWRSRFSDFLYKADPASPVRTIKAKPGASSGPFHWDNRRFTIAEQAALQSFPLDFEWPSARTTAQELIGNAVPPKLGRAVGDAVNQQAFDAQLQFVPRLLDADESLDIIARRRTSTETYKELARDRIIQVYDESVAPSE